MTSPPPSPEVDPEPPRLPGYITVWAVRRMCLRALLLTGITFLFTGRDLAQEAPPGELALFALFMTTGVALCLGPASLLELRARAIGIRPGPGHLALAWVLSIVGVAALVPEAIYATVMLETGSMTAAYAEVQLFAREVLSSPDDVFAVVMFTTVIPLIFLGASAIHMQLMGTAGRNAYLFFTFPMGLIVIAVFAIVDVVDGLAFGAKWPSEASLAKPPADVPPAAESANPEPPRGTLPP